MAFLAWLSWPVFIGVGLLCARLNMVEYGVYAGLAVMFGGLALCIWAGVVSRPRLFFRELLFTLFVVGVWACIGRLAFAMFRT